MTANARMPKVESMALAYARLSSDERQAFHAASMRIARALSAFDPIVAHGKQPALVGVLTATSADGSISITVPDPVATKESAARILALLDDEE